jgi:hypothetical protein
MHDGEYESRPLSFGIVFLNPKPSRSAISMNLSMMRAVLSGSTNPSKDISLI